MAADHFAIEAQGHMDFANNIALKASFYMSPDLSKDLVSSVPELEGLLNEDGQIYIPLTPYDGKLASLKIFPDFEYLTKKIILSKGKQEEHHREDHVAGRELIRNLVRGIRQGPRPIHTAVGNRGMDDPDESKGR